MKPREKIVTAEDVQSSLYFVHVEQPEDVHLIDPPEFQEPNYSDQRQTSTDLGPAPVVQRKAVPGASGIAAAPPMRKPVPGTLAPINNYASKQNTYAGNYSRGSGTLGPDYNPRRSFDSSQYRQENQRPTASPRRLSENPPRASPSLTLIRRDPASGAQWNVARIEDPPVLDISSSTSDDPSAKKKIGAPMYIEVFNPGYSKFLHSETTGKPPLPSRDTGLSVRSYQAGRAQMPEPQRETQLSTSENIFRRRIWMEGSQYAGAGFGHRKHNSHEYKTIRPDSRGSYAGQSQPSPMDVRPPPTPPFLTHEDQTYGSIQVSDRPTSFRGYVFTSPWNGRCEFVTGAGGGSLKVAIGLVRICQRSTNYLIVSTYRPRAPRSAAYGHDCQRAPFQPSE
jgi:hypothetical protein